MHQEILLAIIVSVDTYLAAAAYCNSGIRIPAASGFIINLVGAAVLCLSLMLSELLGRFISPEVFSLLGFAVLTAIGVITIFKSLVRSLVRRLTECRELSMKMGGAGIVVKLYLDDTAADLDHSKSLSPWEAAALALASSLDSAAIGISSGFSDIRPVFGAVSVFLAGFLAMAMGNLTGKKISSLNHDLSWVGGVLLIGFAVFEILV